MKHSNLKRCVLRPRLPLGIVLLTSLGLAACNKPPTSSTESCGTYAKLLCEKADPESSQCEAIRVATDLMPPAACAAGLRDVEYTTKKLESIQAYCNDVAQKICTAVGPDSDGCKYVMKSYKRLRLEQCKGIEEHLPEVIAKVQEHHNQGGRKTVNPSPVSSHSGGG